MDCSQARDLLSDFQDGTMDEAAAAGLAAHLRGCGECAGAEASLLAVRELLRGLPPDPAPPELLARVHAAIEAEDRDAGAHPVTGGAGAARPFLSRFRVPIEAAAAVLLVASVYWYQKAPAPTVRPPAATVARAPEATPPMDISPKAVKAPPSFPLTAKAEAVKTPPSRSIAAKAEAVKALPSRPIAVKEEAASAPVTASETAPSPRVPRTWAAEGLPSVPAYFASTNSERVGSAEPDGGAGIRVARSFAPPSRLLRPLPYGRDIVVDVDPESREGAEDRIAEAALRLGGIFERVDRGDEAAPGSVRVILPVFAAARFVEEMGRIGTIPPEGKPTATGPPAGPRPGTVAYTVRVRVR